MGYIGLKLLIYLFSPSNRCICHTRSCILHRLLCRCSYWREMFLLVFGQVFPWYLWRLGISFFLFWRTLWGYVCRYSNEVQMLFGKKLGMFELFSVVIWVVARQTSWFGYWNSSSFWLFNRSRFERVQWVNWFIWYSSLLNIIDWDFILIVML